MAPTVVLLALALLWGVACDSKSETTGPAAPPSATSPPAGASSPTASASASAPGQEQEVDHSTHDCTLHSEPRPPLPPGASAHALDAASRTALTTIRVSAHEGGVIVRKRGQKWVTVGKRGCTVPAPRMRRALDNLASLTASPDTQELPVGSKFELQIDAMIGETHALHFEVAHHDGDADLVRLLDDSTIKLKGLDRRLWTPDPKLWCTTP